MDPGECDPPGTLCLACRSELQSGFAGGVGQSRHASMIPISPAIETDRLDSLVLGTTGDQLADMGRGRLVAAVCHGLANFRLHSSRGNQGHTQIVVDELCVNMLRTSENGEPGAFRRTMKTSAYPKLTTAAPDCCDALFAHDRCPLRGSCRPISDRTAPPVRMNVPDFVTSIRRPCRPCDGRLRLRNAHPCPCKVPGDEPSEDPRRIDRRPAYRHRSR